MTLDRELLKHALPGAGVYYVLPDELTRSDFDALLAVFARRGASSSTPASADDHWAALEARKTGRTRWDHVSPCIDLSGSLSAERIRESLAAQQTIDNIVKRRPFTAFTLDGLQY